MPKRPTTHKPFANDRNPVHRPKTDKPQRIRGRKNQSRRADLLRRNPLCPLCLVAGRHTPATELDHRIALQFGGTEAESNTWMLCGPCHARKTAIEKKTKQPMELPKDIPQIREREYVLA